MVRKRKKQEEEKPWCFYCDREFSDENDLILHQKNKHFKCLVCNKRLSTAKALSVHSLQVHKVTVKQIPDAKDGRDDPSWDIFGSSGIPAGMRRGDAPPKLTAGSLTPPPPLPTGSHPYGNAQLPAYPYGGPPAPFYPGAGPPRSFPPFGHTHMGMPPPGPMPMPYRPHGVGPQQHMPPMPPHMLGHGAHLPITARPGFPPPSAPAPFMGHRPPPPHMAMIYEQPPRMPPGVPPLPAHGVGPYQGPPLAPKPPVPASEVPERTMPTAAVGVSITSAPSSAATATGPAAPGSTGPQLVWSVEDVSMEERRASLPKYTRKA